MKVGYVVEAGKVTVNANAEFAMDADKDGKVALQANSQNVIVLDTYELVTELLKKDVPLLEMVLKNMNYKPA